MKPIVLSAALLMFGAFASGCAAEGDMRADADYPVGYTPPSEVPPPAPVPAQGQGQAQVQGQVQAQGQGQGQGQGDIEVGGAGASDEYSDTDPSALTDFRSTLEPYGTWEDDPTYGTVWVPSESVVGNDFAPYVSAGHWVYDDDYTWVSDYDWGWAPFHYGRWVYLGGTGWGWIPGRTYAGAWVTWRCGYDDWGYVGWAPLPPTWYWYHGWAYGVAVVPPAPYVFVGTGDVFAPAVAGRVVTGSQVGVVASHTRVYTPANPQVGGNPSNTTPRLNNARFTAGPSPSSLHIPPNAVVHSTPNMAGATQIARAQQFARPSTAVSMGARGPMNGSVANTAVAHNGAFNGAVNGGNTGTLRSGSGYTGRPYTGGTTGSYPTYHSYPSYHYSQPAYRGPSTGATRPYYGSGTTSHPYYGGGHPTYTAPSNHFSPTPSYHPPSGGMPSYHAPSYSTHPSFSGGGGGSFHPSGGGGFHGGGGGHGGHR
jgi:uncharacterized membrane protein YgcG